MPHPTPCKLCRQVLCPCHRRGRRLGELQHLHGVTQVGQTGAGWLGCRSGPQAALPPTQVRSVAQGVTAKRAPGSPRSEMSVRSSRAPVRVRAPSGAAFPGCQESRGDFTLLHTARFICSTNSYANKCQTCFSSFNNMFNKYILAFQLEYHSGLSASV